MCRSKAILRQRCRSRGRKGRVWDTVSRYSPFTTIPESTVVLHHRASQVEWCTSTLCQLNPIFFGYTDTENEQKKKRQHRHTIIIWPQGVTYSLVTTELYQIYRLWRVHSLEWHSNLPTKGKIKNFIGQYEVHYRKKSQCSIYQAYEVLHEYI